jgi:hypothetical protein
MRYEPTTVDQCDGSDLKIIGTDRSPLYFKLVTGSGADIGSGRVEWKAHELRRKKIKLFPVFSRVGAAECADVKFSKDGRTQANVRCWVSAQSAADSRLLAA